MPADVMASNGNGSLVRIDHTNTYEGTATVDGKVVKKKFRSTTREEAISRWMSWQQCKTSPPKAVEEIEEEIGEMAGSKTTSGSKATSEVSKLSVIKFTSGRSTKIVAAFVDCDKALAMASALDTALEVSGAEGKYDVDEVEVWG